jgi:phosphoserine phosphatase
MCQVVSGSLYTSVTTYLQQSGFDHRVAIVLMVIDHDGEITDAQSTGIFLSHTQSIRLLMAI